MDSQMGLDGLDGLAGSRVGGGLRGDCEPGDVGRCTVAGGGRWSG